MAEEERSERGGVPGRLVQDVIAQLRGITDGLEGLAKFGERFPTPPGALPLPGNLSAAQLTTITDAIAAQRQSIRALQAQLSSFDQQLALLERIVRPLTDWSSRWADLETRLLTLGRGHRGEEPEAPVEDGT